MSHRGKGKKVKYPSGKWNSHKNIYNKYYLVEKHQQKKEYIFNNPLMSSFEMISNILLLNICTNLWGRSVAPYHLLYPKERYLSHYVGCSKRAHLQFFDYKLHY